MSTCWPGPLGNAFCFIGVCCGYTSTVIWILVLVPQIYYNYRRKTTEGLSLSWALANFTASLINCFFAYRLDLPLFSKISASYMPCLEIIIIAQFFLYSPYSLESLPKETIAKYIISIIAWISILGIEIGSRGAEWENTATNALQWMAVLLWCIELLPQLYINFEKRSTLGQSSVMVILAFIGKTTDFGSAYLLDMPMQTATLAFWSSSTAYINTMQLIFYSHEAVQRAKAKTDIEQEDRGQVIESFTILDVQNSVLVLLGAIGGILVLFFVSFVFRACCTASWMLLNVIQIFLLYIVVIIVYKLAHINRKKGEPSKEDTTATAKVSIQ